MTPFERIEAQYLRHPKEEPFLNYVWHHHRHGFVFSRPDFFVMARPVRKDAGEDLIKDCRVLFSREVVDCWYIFAASGNMGAMWRCLPYPLAWFSWVRLHDPTSELQFCKTERLKRLCPPDLGISNVDASLSLLN